MCPMRKLIAALATVGAVGAWSVGPAAAGETLDAVKARGELICGVNTGLPGFSLPDDKGHWTGIDADVCRGVAAAVLGDANKVKFVPLTAKERLTALQSGEIDILSRNTTWTHSRDTTMGVSFTGTTYYDGQGFLVRKALGVTSAKQLDGASICILSGTTTELNVADYFRTKGMKFSPVVFDNADQTSQGFESGRCDVLTSDQSQLYALRLKLSDPASAVVLPEVISKEPLGPSVRQGDDQWFSIVRWALFAQLNAEELGVTSANVDEKKASTDPNVRRLLGTDGDLGKQMGLTNEWAYNIVKQVGNYGEIFEKNLGKSSPLQIARGLNALWTQGGIQYAPPVR
ncbi:Lysine-arginine-ornithine-binding periplasmic protein [Pararhodospirillum photometricum DSM 122]|uniref:Lysine-arginine-ornithine-binding periplasmic protein n=2 Tax=Pararhodospirillum photometricum TaxID=1084 RepID=H6SR62_PARPM|nr:Lysine-arginine-ornithine-binding periplasmic protein [Pararhodospirillum photometricum DSM 122]